MSLMDDYQRVRGEVIARCDAIGSGASCDNINGFQQLAHESSVLKTSLGFADNIVNNADDVALESLSEVPPEFSDGDKQLLVDAGFRSLVNASFNYATVNTEGSNLVDAAIIVAADVFEQKTGFRPSIPG